MNQDALIQNANTTDSALFVSEFPGTTFDITFSQNSSSNFTEFSELVTAHGHKLSSSPPFMYGSYQLYEADAQKHDYKFLTFANLTSRDSSILYTHFMHEAVLRMATNESNLEFNVVTRPFPRTNMYQTMIKILNSGSVIIYTGIMYSVMLTPIVSYLVLEAV